MGRFFVVLCILFSSVTDISEAMAGQMNKTVLAVDLDGNGKIDRIPLENSNIYFDVDGDGLAERTEWIAPQDGFVSVYEEPALADSYDPNIGDMMASFLLGIDRLRKYDTDQNGIYDQNDYYHWHSPNPSVVADRDIEELVFFISRDTESDGFPDGKGEGIIRCDLVSFDFSDRGGKYILNCKDHSYPVYEVALNFQDSNVLWESLCDKLEYKGVSFRDEKTSGAQIRCLKQGYDPKGIWNSVAWDKIQHSHAGKE